MPPARCEVAGLPEGGSRLRMHQADGCDPIRAAAITCKFSPLLMLADGVGPVTTLIGAMPLEDLRAGETGRAGDALAERFRVICGDISA